MDIVKVFHANDFTKAITILGSPQDPLFKASDIAEILEMSNIRASIVDFDETEKVMSQSSPGQGGQQTLFLTEKGLYKVMFKSRKPFAVQFQDWVCDVIKEIRQTGYYSIAKELDKTKASLDEAKATIANLEEESKLMKQFDGRPIIYIYDTDKRIPASNQKRTLKIGVTEHFQKRIKPYKQVTPFGGIVFHVPCSIEHLRMTEQWIHTLLKPYRQAGEVFEIEFELAKKWIIHISTEIDLSSRSDQRDVEALLSKIVDCETGIVGNRDLGNSAFYKTCCTQTEDEYFESVEKEDPPADPKTPTDLHEKFDKFIEEACLVEPVFEISSTDIIGQYRLWSRSVDKETYLALNDYLHTRFKPIRLPTMSKLNVVNGFRGVKLKEIVYPQLPFAPTDPELFMAHSCKFTPSAKVLMSDIVDEYTKWGKSVNKDVDKKDIKMYLKNSPHVLISNLWTSNGNGQGYYGVCIRNDEFINRVTSTTAKAVTKRTEGGDVIASWTTIAKAAQDEGISAAKMSRAIKNKTTLNGFVYIAG